MPAADTAGVPLDVAVRDARRGLDHESFAPPATLVLLGTGLGLLPERLSGARDLALGGLPSVPPRWHGARLWSGDLGGHPVWLLDDLSTDPTPAAGPAWESAFPVWLAAAAGARLCLHTSAGSGLDPEGPHAAGTFALARDHINLSGASPLVGLGESTLGPLFPDLSRLHHPELLHAAQGRATDLGLEAHPAVVACTAGPALETPAERRYLARAGADVAVQGLAAPLLAAAHAGLRALTVIAIAERGPGPTRLRDVVAAAGAAEAALEDLLLSLAPDLDRAARDAAEDL